MKNFQVLLSGKNFLFDIDGEKKLSGFVTTRWVRAANSSEAELAAVELIKKDVSLINMVLNTKGEEPTPRVFLEEIAEVGWITYLRHKPGRGYIFYQDNGENDHG